MLIMLLNVNKYIFDITRHCMMRMGIKTLKYHDFSVVKPIP